MKENSAPTAEQKAGIEEEMVMVVIEMQNGGKIKLELDASAGLLRWKILKSLCGRAFMMGLPSTG